MPEASLSSDLPAILGGTPLRPEGPPSWPPDDPQVRDVLSQLAADGSWGRYHGPHCDRLIEALKRLHGCEHVLLCSSGTAAIELALRGVGVKAADEVILAAYDYKANFTDVLAVGATPVLVDVLADDCQLDADQLDAAVSEKTRAIVASHLHGGLVDLPAVQSVADAHGIAVIEDACQATGATVDGRAAGLSGDVGVISFGGSKLLTAGRGGALLTNRDDIAQRVRLYAHRGNDAYPLSEMQAAVLLPQVDQLRAWHARRADAVAFLHAELAKLAGVRPFEAKRAGASPAFYKLGLWYDPAAFSGLSRDRFAAAVRAEGIAFDPGFRGLHIIHSRRRFRTAGDLPRATHADAHVVTLHHPVLLEPESSLRQIVAAIERVAQHAASVERGAKSGDAL